MERNSEEKQILSWFFKAQTQFLINKYKHDEQTTLIIRTINIAFDDLINLNEELKKN